MKISLGLFHLVGLPLLVVLLFLSGCVKQTLPITIIEDKNVDDINGFIPCAGSQWLGADGSCHSFGSGGGGSIYSGVSPILVDNDLNTVGISWVVPDENIVSAANWNAKASIADINNNGQFVKVSDSNNTGRLLYSVIANPPNLSGYALQSDINANFVPYTGAINDVNLNSHDINANNALFSSLGIGSKPPAGSKLFIGDTTAFGFYNPIFGVVSTQAKPVISSTTPTSLEVARYSDINSLTLFDIAGVFFEKPQGKLETIDTQLYGLFGGANATANDFNNAAKAYFLYGLGFTVTNDNNLLGTSTTAPVITHTGLLVSSTMGAAGKRIADSTKKKLTTKNYGANITATYDGNYASDRTNSINVGAYISTVDSLDVPIGSGLGKITNYSLYLDTMANTNLNGGVSWAIYSEDNVPSYLRGDLNINNLIDLNSNGFINLGTATSIGLVAGDLNASGIINSSGYKVLGIAGIDKNVNIMKTAITTCDLNFLKGILVASDC